MASVIRDAMSGPLPPGRFTDGMRPSVTPTGRPIRLDTAAMEGYCNENALNY
jgi:hypothetical protein